jgi:hypothetical protein
MVHITVILSGMNPDGHSECHSVILTRVLVFHMVCRIIHRGIRVTMVIPHIPTDGDTTHTDMVMVMDITHTDMVMDTIMADITEITTDIIMDTIMGTTTTIVLFTTGHVKLLRTTVLQVPVVQIRSTVAG